MSKVDKIGDKVLPNYLLASALDEVENIEAVMLVTLGKDGKILVGRSATTPETICLLLKVLEMHVTQMLEDNNA